MVCFCPIVRFLGNALNLLCDALPPVDLLPLIVPAGNTTLRLTYLPNDRLFPYEITVSALALAFIILILILINQRQLLPGIVILGTFILFVLWLTGLIQTAIQLFGPSGSVNANCNLYVNSMPVSGTGDLQAVLAYLQQRSICQSWQAAFAFEVVGTVFFLWMMIMAWQVQQDEYE